MRPEECILVADVETPMVNVLDFFSWHYRGIPGQTTCPVHKQGQETRASARLYEDGLYCYSCGKQYRPTEIYAAMTGGDRLSAAQEMLEKWPVSQVKIQQIIRNFTLPKIKPAEQAILDTAESYLLSFKHKTSLPVYREWVFKLLHLGEVLAGEPVESQKLKLIAFKNQMFRTVSANEEETQNITS